MRKLGHGLRTGHLARLRGEDEAKNSYISEVSLKLWSGCSFYICMLWTCNLHLIGMCTRTCFAHEGPRRFGANLESSQTTTAPAMSISRNASRTLQSACCNARGHAMCIRNRSIPVVQLTQLRKLSNLYFLDPGVHTSSQQCHVPQDKMAAQGMEGPG
jgi:hypothetical protein